jgi:hypothetical protein
MKNILLKLPQELTPGEIWSRDSSPELGAIQCTRGMLWLTQTGRGEDVLLRAGEAYAPLPRGRIVAQALERSAFTLKRRESWVESGLERRTA